MQLKINCLYYNQDVRERSNFANSFWGSCIKQPWITLENFTSKPSHNFAGLRALGSFKNYKMSYIGLV